MNPTAEYRRIICDGLPAAMEAQRADLVTEGARRCPACGSALRPFRLNPRQLNYRCGMCGLMERSPAHEPAFAAGAAHHFRAVDPHGAVAASKAGFYAQALGYLNSRIRRQPRTLLDVGCGFGYFLERAAAGGWQTMGVDIVAEAVSVARKRVPSAHLFAEELREAGLAAGSLDAIAMWDVLDMVPDPAAELAECIRVLAPGGIIGIRIRNLVCQLWFYRGYTWLGWLWRRAGIKCPFTFHRHSFTPKAIEHLLARAGFSEIESSNSPLTQGDPYEYSPLRGLTAFGKFGVAILSGLIDRLTGGRLLLGPSLLVWARKPPAGC
jgi:SAM-dependent methyltransferase